MNKPDESLISLNQFCTSCGIEISFVQALSEQGLCELVEREATTYVLLDEIARLERLSRLHYEMEINLEGLHAISHLQKKIEDLEEQVKDLKRKLQRHESTHLL
ncbi:chaperone modulator CbpM [Cyclobacterium roseum]|uniref:chaperone modulator CbpM n=1 Tax=Cyclobacterium roseum TaxID=2666137 RepID=UPI0013910549|nr:chaperone modulator CbpM [Cyclobacterium roseum]